MLRLDRAIVREVIPLALICLLGLTFLFTTVGLFQIVNRFEVTPRFTTLLAFWPVLWKSLLPMTLPISLTFAAAMVYGRMRGEGELLVLASAGVSPWRHFVVLVPLGLICGALSFYAASEMGPDAYARRFALSRQALADFVNFPPGGARELRLTGLDLSYADARNGYLHDLTIILHHDDGPSDQQGLLASLSAESARIRYDIEKRELVLVDVRRPRVVCFDPKTGAPGTPRIEVFGGANRLLSPAMSASQIANLRWKFDFESREKAEGAKALDTAALLDSVEREAQGKGPREAAGELVRRAGLGFAGLLLPLLGALLASLVNHPNRLLAIAAGVIPGALLFFPLMTTSSGLARGGFDATAACLLAPLMLLAACSVVLARHQRGRWL